MQASMWRLAGSVRGAIAASSLLGLLITASYVAQGLFLAQAVAVIAGRGTLSDAGGWIAAFGLSVALRAVLLWTNELMVEHIAQRTKETLRLRLLSKLLLLGVTDAADRRTGDLQTTIVAGVEALESYFSRYVPAVVVAIVGCTGILACLAWVDLRTALLLGAFVIALPLADKLWLRWRMPKSSGIFAAMGAFAAALLDSLQGIATLKAFDAAGRRRAQLAERAATLRRESMTTLSVTLMRTGLTGLIALSGVGVVVVMNAWRVSSGTLAPVTLLITLFLAREAFRPLERLEKAFHTAWAAAGAAGPMIALLDTPQPVAEPTAPQPRPQHADVAFDAVSFHYPATDGSASAALSQVSFKVEEGTRVALVGPSGAGKSTVATLLLRFFDPQSGVIRIGGVDIRQLSLDTLRSLVSVVSQDTYLFHGSIEDNLRLARPGATLEEIRAAARAAHIDEFIASLPQGYATPVGERGTQLSGGQRQRLAIARALLKRAPILLLDEATSNVDAASEHAIQAALDDVAGKCTMLVIAHRLSTVLGADRIVVLDRGGVVETGSHDELLSRQGLYATLYRSQQLGERRGEAA